MSGLVMLGRQAAGWMVRSGRAARRRSDAAACAPVPALPSGLDAGTLLDAACEQFIRLQAAWDAGDRATLAALTTPEMLEELSLELPGAADGPNRSEVLSLEASLLGFDDLGAAWLASIEFSGMIRETAERGPLPFRELWLLTRERREDPGSCRVPWRLARQQALL